jgi:hypothetical protein
MQNPLSDITEASNEDQPEELTRSFGTSTSQMSLPQALSAEQQYDPQRPTRDSSTHIRSLDPNTQNLNANGNMAEPDQPGFSFAPFVCRAGQAPAKRKRPLPKMPAFVVPSANDNPRQNSQEDSIIDDSLLPTRDLCRGFDAASILTHSALALPAKPTQLDQSRSHRTKPQGPKKAPEKSNLGFWQEFGQIVPEMAFNSVLMTNNQDQHSRLPINLGHPAHTQCSNADHQSNTAIHEETRPPVHHGPKSIRGRPMVLIGPTSSMFTEEQTLENVNGPMREIKPPENDVQPNKHADVLPPTECSLERRESQSPVRPEHQIASGGRKTNESIEFPADKYHTQDHMSEHRNHIHDGEHLPSNVQFHRKSLCNVSFAPAPPEIIRRSKVITGETFAAHSTLRGRVQKQKPKPMPNVGGQYVMQNAAAGPKERAMQVLLWSIQKEEDAKQQRAEEFRGLQSHLEATEQDRLVLDAQVHSLLQDKTQLQNQLQHIEAQLTKCKDTSTRFEGLAANLQRSLKVSTEEQKTISQQRNALDVEVKDLKSQIQKAYVAVDTSRIDIKILKDKYHKRFLESLKAIDSLQDEKRALQEQLSKGEELLNREIGRVTQLEEQQAVLLAQQSRDGEQAVKELQQSVLLHLEEIETFVKVIGERASPGQETLDVLQPILNDLRSRDEVKKEDVNKIHQLLKGIQVQ